MNNEARYREMAGFFVGKFCYILDKEYLVPMKQFLLLLNLLAVLIPVHYTAQTATTIANGNWANPSTWDCSCTPVDGYSITVNHQVTLDTSIVFTYGGEFLINSTGSLIQDSVGNRDISIWGDFTNNGIVNCRQYQDSMSNSSTNNGVFQVKSFVSHGYNIFYNNGIFISDSLLNQNSGYFEGNGTVTSNVIINSGVFDIRGQINADQIINHMNFDSYDGIKCNSLINFKNFSCNYLGSGYYDDSLLVSGDLINYGDFRTNIYTRISNNFVNVDTTNTTMFWLETEHYMESMKVKNWRNEDLFYGTPLNHVNVSDSSVNTGEIHGEFGFMFCDFTPPSSFPFIDINTGTIEASVEWCNTVGLKENKDRMELIAFPNPGNGDFTITATTNTIITITDELGRVVGTNELNEGNHFTDQIVNLESGIYFLSSSDKRIWQKIVVSGE